MQGCGCANGQLYVLRFLRSPRGRFSSLERGQMLPQLLHCRCLRRSCCQGPAASAEAVAADPRASAALAAVAPGSCFVSTAQPARSSRALCVREHAREKRRTLPPPARARTRRGGRGQRAAGHKTGSELTGEAASSVFDLASLISAPHPEAAEERAPERPTAGLAHRNKHTVPRS